jgi:hypothetical protein
MTVLESGILLPMALEIYLIAPYAELEKVGGATVEESLMANYASVGIFTRTALMLRNKKWGLICLAISGILGLGLNIAAAGLIESRNVNVRSLNCTFESANHYLVPDFHASACSSHCSTRTRTGNRRDKWYL